MKNHRFNLLRRASFAAPLTIALSFSATADDLTWIGPDPGIWDAGSTANWDNLGATTWTNGDNAIFSAGTYQVDLTSTGVTVGDLTYGGGGILELKGSTPTGSTGDIITINTGGATWDTGGGEIEFFNDGNNNNTLLSMTSGDTLTVQGGGVFDAGQNPQNNANGTWQVTGATLDVTAVTVVRGQQRSTAQFGTVKMVADSIFVQERNSNQDLNNDWVVTGPGNVKFGNRYNRISWLNGAFSGDAGLTFFNGGNATNGYFRLNNAANSFSGGVVVDAAANETLLQVTSDATLGAVPGSLDAANITLRNDGILRAGFSLNANRGITLDTGGTLIPTAASHMTVNSPVAGDGGLKIGLVGEAPVKYVIMKTTNSYAGGTDLVRGDFFISNDDQLGAVPGAFDDDNVIIRNDSFFKFQNANVTMDANRGITLADGGGTIIAGTNNSSTNHIINGPIIGTGDLTIGYSTDTSTGTVTLNSAATYVGATNIRRGHLQLGVSDAIPTDSVLTIGGSAGASSLKLNGFNQTLVGLNSTGTNSPKQIVNGSSTASTLTVNGAANSTYSAQMGNTGLAATDDANNFDVVKTGAGTLDVTLGSARFNGGLSVNGGTYMFNSDGELGAAPAAPTVDSITLDGGTLRAHMVANITINANRLITLGVGGGTIQTSTPGGAFSVTYNGVISGLGGLTKISAQSLNLGGANTYTGATAINSGTFRLSGSLTSDVTVTSSNIVPGDQGGGSGSGTMNALTFATNGKLNCFINTSTVDATKAVVSGAVSIDPTATLGLTDSGADVVLATGTKLTLVDYTGGSLTGTFAGIADGDSVVVGSNTFILDYDDGTTVTLTADNNTYDSWAAGFLPDLTDSTRSLDFDLGGLETGIEYVVGGDPTLGSDDAGLAPTSAYTGSALEFTFRRTDLANDDPNTTIYVEYGSDLNGWTTAVDGDDGVVITVNDDFYSVPLGIDQVIVSLPDSLEMGGKIFARLATSP